MDSHIYAYYTHLLGQRYEDYLNETHFEHAVLAFRKLGKSNIQFAREAFRAIQKIGEADVIAADFSDFFGNLNHRILKTAWSKVLGVTHLPPDHYNIYKSLARFSTVEKQYLYAALKISIHNPRSRGFRICEPEEFRTVVRNLGLINRNTASHGIPQGSPISALLSNIYMIGFDEAMWSAVSAAGGKYYRYCDDMLIIAPRGKGSELRKLAESLAAINELTLHPKKTEERRFTMSPLGLVADKPLQYLGFIFDGQRVFLRSASLARYADRMRRGVRLARATMHRRNALRVERGENPRPLYVGKLYKRYSYIGRRNFIAYALRASREFETSTIKRQVKPLWGRLQRHMRVKKK